MKLVADRQRQLVAMSLLRSGVVLIFLLIHSSAQIRGQSPDAKLNASKPEGLAQLSSGSITGNVYHNEELGFRYGFPKGWIVDDKATQQRGVANGRQFVWADETGSTKERGTRQCTKDLLFVTQFPEDMRTNELNAFAFLIVADPRCAPGVAFPSTVKDQAAIQSIANHLGIYFQTSGITSRSPARIRAFDNAGRVMLEISQSLWISTREPGSATSQSIRSSVLAMQAGDYWVLWMFAASDEARMNQLRASKIFFDAPQARLGVKFDPHQELAGALTGVYAPQRN